MINKKKILKYLQNPSYYTYLTLERIKMAIHNIVEPRKKVKNTPSFEDFQLFLWKKLLNKLIFSEAGFYYNTKVKNNNSPMLLSQARVILILCNNYNKSDYKFKSIYLIKSMTDYLISMRGKNGLFKFNKPPWDKQDEGIASEWATLALIKAYNITNEKKYLNIAISTMNSMIEHLYTKETSLVHTAGDNFWCLNSASTFAYVCSLLLNYAYSKKVEIAMIDSINLCTDKIAEDGHFPYNSIKTGTYLLLYHPIVMITLGYCLSSKYLDSVTRKNLTETLNKAKNFLLKSINKEKKIFEPEIKHFSQNIVSNVTTLVALKSKLDADFERILLNNVIKFWKDDKLYLCIDQKERLYNSDSYNLKDVYIIEVMYWLDIYLN